MIPATCPSAARAAARRLSPLLAAVSAMALLPGCAVVSVAGAAAGATITVAGAAVGTGISVAGKVATTAIDLAVPDDDEDQDDD